MKTIRQRLVLGLVALGLVGSGVFALNGQTAAREQRLRCQRIERELGPERRRLQGVDLPALEKEVEDLRAAVRDQRRHLLPGAVIAKRQAKLAEDWTLTSTQVTDANRGNMHRVSLATLDRNVAEWPALAGRMDELLRQTGTQLVSLEVVAAGEQDGRRLERVELNLLYLEQTDDGSMPTPKPL